MVRGERLEGGSLVRTSLSKVDMELSLLCQLSRAHHCPQRKGRGRKRILLPWFRAADGWLGTEPVSGETGAILMAA